MASVSYTRMADMTEADLRLINADGEDDALELPGRLMDAVAELERFQGALKVTRLEHSLQSATRAYRAGKDKDTWRRLCSMTSAMRLRPIRTANWSGRCSDRS
jgi:hypothetical protein